MPKYKLWLPSPGETIPWDEGALVSFVAETAQEAFEFVHDMWDEHGCWMDWMEDGVGDGWIHPEIASGRIVYKRDIDNEELLHEGAEPGETTFELLRDDGRELHRYEVRVWLPGPARAGWVIKPPWATTTNCYEVEVGRSGWSSAHETLELAEAALERRMAAWVARWKDKHPECWSARDPRYAPILPDQRLTAARLEDRQRLLATIDGGWANSELYLGFAPIGCLVTKGLVRFELTEAGRRALEHHGSQG